MKGGSKDATGWAARSSRNRRRRRECARQIRQSDGQDKPSDRIDALTDGSETLGGSCWVGDREDEVPSRRQEAGDKANCWGSALETGLAPPPILGVLFTRTYNDLLEDSYANLNQSLLRCQLLLHQRETGTHLSVSYEDACCTAAPLSSATAWLRTTLINPSIMNLSLVDPFVLAQDCPEALTGRLRTRPSSPKPFGGSALTQRRRQRAFDLHPI